MDLRELLTEWLAFRTETVRRRLQNPARQGRLQRLHILEGLLIAFLNIDEVIRIIRTEDKPRPVLMARFGLSEIQAEAILETEAASPGEARGDEDPRRAGRAGRRARRLEQTLGSAARLKQADPRRDREADAEEFGDARRSPIVEREAAQARPNCCRHRAGDRGAVDRGWVRAAKGHEIDPRSLCSTRPATASRHAARGKQHAASGVHRLDRPRYSLPAHSLPSARGQGEPLSGA
jgi:topoisomerase-4 subunit A